MSWLIDLTKRISLTKLEFGCKVDKTKTTFNIFAINADYVTLAVYDKYDSVRRTLYSMSETEDNIWRIVINENLSRKFYVYIINRKGIELVATYPYSAALSLNADKSAIIDWDLVDSKSFDEHKNPFNAYNEAIIYEMHVRDFTSSITIDVEYKKKFLGLTESNVMNTGEDIGFNHIKELGITHIHLMPINSFVKVESENTEGYNWGYNPDSYFALESSYSNDPTDPYSSIKEFRELVKQYHENDISVVIGVVYNHTYRGLYSNFEVLAPNIFYRRDENGNLSNGSGCGNEINSEDPLVRRVILDSLKFMMTKYKVDGFRFDLLGLMDTITMYKIAKELREINPNVLMYGEPWTAGDSTLDLKKRVLKGIQKNRKFSLFNDDYRNALKGDNDGSDKGYIQGETSKVNEVKKGISGSLITKTKGGFTSNPSESINYICAHDNLIIYDKILKSINGISNEENLKVNKLGFFLLMMSFGIPFIHEGTEFGRTKHMDYNSYRSGDYVNEIDWSFKHSNSCLFNYVKKLIEIRKQMKFFTNYDKSEIEENLVFYNLTQGAIGYEINDIYEKIKYVYFINPSTNDVETAYAKNEFKSVLIDSFNLERFDIPENDIGMIRLPARSTLIMIRK